jgi:iron complex transport system ATP-binding protein
MSVERGPKSGHGARRNGAGAGEAPRPPALAARDLAVGYRHRKERRAVLERVNLSVERGELVCLLGPNGIGKSTLMRTLARMQPPLWGAIEIDGTAIGSLSASALAQRLGVVLTERVAVESLRARQIVALGRYPHSGWLGGLNQRDDEVVAWAIDAVGATHLADRDFARMSDGERQRIMVARALAQEPVLLMLDEPTAFLDVPGRVELMGLLRRLSHDNDLAVVVTTHDLELALRTADVIWLLMPGGEVVVGAPEDVMLSGAIAQAFEGRQIRFHPEERSFRWLTGERGYAVVTGRGLRAAMVKAVLEREGFAVTSNGARPSVAVTIDDVKWTASTPEEGSAASGETFRALAAYLRALAVAAPEKGE